jgi:membrane dipeptidase
MSHALLFVPLAAALFSAMCPSPPDSTDPPGAASDTLRTADGGRVAMPAALVRRLVAEDPLWAEALRIHFDAIVVDGHIDTPSLMLDSDYDLGARHSAEHVDLPRMVEGGLDAPFFAIYVGRSYGEGQAATDRALAMTEAVQRQVNALDGVDMATSAAEVADITRAGRKAILLGLEGGHALQGDVNVLRQLYANGIRYVTLTHTNTNSWADASTDAPRWGGLNDLGRSLVREMNRLGVLVDLSHVSDSTFYDAIETSAAPVLLSHTSCRALHDHARNIDDDALRALRANGGVILINFYDAYIGTAPVTVDTILDHIEHAIEVAGIDHVGLGSDFDGVPSLPVGMEDATRLPWITYGLLKRGHSEADVRKVLGGNALRLLADAERIGQQIRASGAR